MITIGKNKDCCGCSACVSICPRQCIAMSKDAEGFLYPEINAQECVDCGLCEEICPMLKKTISEVPINIYAVRHPNLEIVKESSSGGVFTLLAEQTIKDGGVVFGACFNEKWEVIHSYADTMENIVLFRGSKYLQSRIEDNYVKVEKFLNEDRKVLFTGTPCQALGLKSFLGKEYPQLMIVDFICHGVASPVVFEDYLSEFISNKQIKLSDIIDINFRNKKNGWKQFGLSITYLKNQKVKKKYENKHDSIYLRGFLQNLYLRPSCHECFVKSFTSGSDITISDYWGIKKNKNIQDDGWGYSVSFIHTQKGNLYFNQLDVFKNQISEEMAYQKAINHSAVPSPNRDVFFSNYRPGYRKISSLISGYLKPIPLFRLLKTKILIAGFVYKKIKNNL